MNAVRGFAGVTTRPRGGGEQDWDAGYRGASAATLLFHLISGCWVGGRLCHSFILSFKFLFKKNHNSFPQLILLNMWLLKFHHKAMYLSNFHIVLKLIHCSQCPVKSWIKPSRQFMLDLRTLVSNPFEGPLFIEWLIFRGRSKLLSCSWHSTLLPSSVTNFSSWGFWGGSETLKNLDKGNFIFQNKLPFLIVCVCVFFKS